MNSLKVEFDDGWRGSKVSFGEREMVNFAFNDTNLVRSTDLGQVKIMVSQKGRLLQLALGLNNITLMAIFVHEQWRLGRSAYDRMCQTCGKAAGIERYDNGLSCGVHCAGCFDEMVSDARKRSW